MTMIDLRSQIYYNSHIAVHYFHGRFLRLSNADIRRGVENTIILSQNDDPVECQEDQTVIRIDDNNILSWRNGPAIISRKNGNVSRWWIQDGRFGNTEYPSFTKHLDTGELLEETWANHSRLHRADGPAVVKYRDGEIISSSFHRNGVIFWKEQPYGSRNYMYHEGTKFKIADFQKWCHDNQITHQGIGTEQENFGSVADYLLFVTEFSGEMK